ncbi:MAG TPA: ornithine cyclodeaminase family protein [Candidatus Binatia bacterium]
MVVEVVLRAIALRSHMLFLQNVSIGQILSFNEMIAAIEDALKELALGRGFDLPRRRIHHPNRMIFGLLPGSVHGVMGAYLQTDLDRRVHHETVILYSIETGVPLMLFQDCAINEHRTGAAGAIGAKYLARANASRVALFGSAVHAETQLKAVAAVRDLTHVRVCSPTAEHRHALAEKLRAELQIPVEAVANPEEALETGDIVITATDSVVPVFDGRQLPAGTHITSIANGDKNRIRQEIDEATIHRADAIFVTSKETVCVNESDIFRAVRDRVVTWDRIHEISSLLLGRVAGRTGEHQITLFKLQGTGIMDVAIGLYAYEKLKDSNLAQRL